MRSQPTRRSQLRRPANLLLHPGTREFGLQPLVTNPRANLANFAWPSANKPVAIPFCISQAITVKQLWWGSGGTPGGTWDIGIYDTSWNRKVSSGSTGGAGTSVKQFVDVADTDLPAGRYYLVVVQSSTTAGRAQAIATTSSAPLVAAFSVFDSTTNAFPLPDPLTNMVANTQFGRLPWCGIAARVPFA